MGALSLSLAALLCGAIAVPLLAAKTPAPAAKSQSAQTSVAEKKDRDLDERNQRRDQVSDVKRHTKEAKHHIGAKSGKEDDDDE